jgi:lysophospholipase L1-like esterase
VSDARRPRALAQNLLLAVGSAVAFLFLLEATLRVLRPDLTVPALEVRHPGRNLAAAFTSGHFIPDRELIWTARPSHPPFNEQGYRGERVATPKPEGEVRILALGDSNTLGHADSWANELATTLDPAPFGGTRVTIVNASVYGYTSYQGRLRMKRYRRYEPDLVLVSFGGNDGSPNAVPDRLLSPSRWETFLERAAFRSRVAAAVRYVAYRRQRTASDPARMRRQPTVPRVSVADYRANLTAMISEARRMGARPVLFTRPFAVDVYADPASPVAAYHPATVAVGAAVNAPVVDLHRMMGCHWSLYQDPSHFNGRGHEVAARLVARALEDIARRGTYDVNEVRYRPEDPAYEELLDALQARVSLWVPPDRARAAMAEAAGARARRTLFDLDAPAELTWKVEKQGDVIRPEGRAWCLSAVAGAPAMVLDLPDADAFHFVWMELDGRAQAAAVLHWDTGTGFSDDQVVSDVFSVPSKERPYRFSFLLPRRARRIRLTLGPLAPGPVCLSRLWVERISPR